MKNSIYSSLYSKVILCGFLFLVINTNHVFAQNSPTAPPCPECVDKVSSMMSLNGKSIIDNSQTESIFEGINNYPNPFNPSTNITFNLKESSFVAVKIYDLSGRLVQTLASGQMSAGKQQLLWDTQATNGSSLASGVYLVQLSTPTYQYIHAINLVK
jgi:hypothetical protein